MDLLTKYCPACSQDKELSLFSNNKAQKDGKHPQCKSCNALYYAVNKRTISPKRVARYYKQQDAMQEYSRAWYAANKERASASCKAWSNRNKDKVRLYAKNSRQRFPHRKNYQTKLYRARKSGAAPRWLTEWDKFVISEYYYKAKRLEALTGVKWHVDHIHPLGGAVSCGLHVPWNLQLLPAEVNIAKGNRL